MPPEEKNGRLMPVLGISAVPTADMQKHLPGDLRDDADAQHRAVQVGRAQGDHNAHDQQHRKRTDEDNTAEEAQLLTDDAEDKVVFGVGQPLVLLHARADAHAEPCRLWR